MPQPLEGQAADADDKIIEQRDYAEEKADELANAIAEITGEDIGEHSSANDPWARALTAAQDYMHEHTVKQAQLEADNAKLRSELSYAQGAIDGLIPYLPPIQANIVKTFVSPRIDAALGSKSSGV